jgi:cytochrome c oxidase subunit 2
VESFDPITRQGLAIIDLFLVELAISALLFAIVAVVMVLALVRFRGPTGDASEPLQVHGNRRLELVWTGVPALVLAVVFILAVQTMRNVNAAASNAQPLRIVGHQWWWEYEFPDRQVIAANELHVPVGTPLQVTLESVDVIHSFHVPQFGWMRDAVPGKINQMSILVDRTVDRPIDGTCNQYCGLQHAWMRIIVIAEPVDAFNAWAERERQPVTASNTRGEQVFLQNTCVNCHTIRGLPTAQGRIGPDLTHLGSRTTLGTGVVTNTAATLQQWIRNASAVKPGVLMPPYQSLTPADLNALVVYLESLK